ncbi:MAG: DUF1579 domain-containing protein [Gammaproteobacteria bacterium]
MNNEPQKEHRWLQKLTGEWTSESECSMEPGKPLEKFNGAESVRSLGDLWVVCEGRSEMPGGGMATMLMTLGYDPEKRRFVGTWVGSMMTHLWIYDGSLDAVEKTLTLNSEGPIFGEENKTAKYRDVIEIRGDDQRALTSYMLGDDGEWQKIMTANYRRKR